MLNEALLNASRDAIISSLTGLEFIKNLLEDSNPSCHCSDDLDNEDSILEFLKRAPEEDLTIFRCSDSLVVCDPTAPFTGSVYEIDSEGVWCYNSDDEEPVGSEEMDIEFELMDEGFYDEPMTLEEQRYREELAEDMKYE